MNVLPDELKFVGYTWSFIFLSDNSFRGTNVVSLTGKARWPDLNAGAARYVREAECSDSDRNRSRLSFGTFLWRSKENVRKP
jgi:hypothetical protein